MNKQLSDYLSEVEARLRSLPSVDREQELAEITQHLETLIAARMSEGQTEADATGEAIAQFGEARDIGNRLYQTDAHKRFVPLVETGVFCAAAFFLPHVVSLIGQIILRTVQAVSPERIAQSVDRFVAPWPLQNWPIAASIGFAAFGLLVLRYGWRGMVEKAWAQTPTGAAVRWVFLITLIGFVRHSVSVLTHPFHVVSPDAAEAAVASLPLQMALGVLTNVLSLSIPFAAAYFVARTSKCRESVADAIGCAVGVGMTTSLLEILFQSVPLPWHHFDTPLPVSGNLTVYLFWLFGTPVWGAINLYIARFGVQRGEARRLSHTINRFA